MKDDEKAEAYDDLIRNLWTGAIFTLENAEDECEESNRSWYLVSLLGEVDGYLSALRNHYERNISYGRNAELSEMLEYFYEDGSMDKIFEMIESKKKYPKSKTMDIIRRAIASVKTMAVLVGVNEERRFKIEFAKYIEKAKENEEENKNENMGTNGSQWERPM